ncbi:MAG: thiamine biosynthesis protein ThiS [Proteobacteria bacterium]|jgi:sulfur carrier protein ThiS|nr:thiamine biosynthesis protein ThiS [Pseudomonadota bacterium]
MRLQVKVTGHLVDYFADSETLLPDGATVEEALSGLGIPTDQVGLVSVNGVAVNKSVRGSRLLSDGDSLTVMAPLTGG